MTYNLTSALQSVPTHLQHGDGWVSLRWQHINQCIAVFMQCHRGWGLEQLPVDGGEDAHIVVRASGRTNNACVLVHCLQELTNYQWHTLDPLHLKTTYGMFVSFTLFWLTIFHIFFCKQEVTLLERILQLLFIYRYRYFFFHVRAAFLKRRHSEFCVI